MTTQEIIQQELDKQARRKELRKFRWDEYIEPVAKQLFPQLLEDRPFLTNKQAWDIAVEESKLQYKRNQKARRLGITFK
mgnify:CR=1 FL=1|tara:strand:+ start:205 stop:441 length:237 start_codon:yes stop_codon:yes gene_type:complete